MLRNRLDQLGKNILQEVLRHRGEVKPETEVPPGDAQRIDLWFVPDETRRRAGPSWTGVLAALAEAPAVIELWSGGLGEKELHGCLRKRYAWHHALEIRDKQDWMMPPLWGLCAGRPDGVLEGFGFEPAPEGPAGHYRTAAPCWRVRLVVLSELPRVRDTILLRLLGRRAVRREAMAELRELPLDADERKVALPWLRRLKLDLEAADPAMLSPEDKEIAMDVQEEYEQWEREVMRKAEEQATRKLEERLTQKLEEQFTEKGRLEPLAHQFERRLGRALSAAEREALAARIREQGAERVGDVVLDLSAEDLAAWLAATNGH